LDNAAIEDHLLSAFPDAILLKRIEWAEGPTGDLPVGYTTLVIQRTSSMLAIATCGASRSDSEIELFILAPSTTTESKQIELVEALVAVAHYSATGPGLDAGHIINIGRPLVSGGSCTHCLVSLPYLDGPALERPSVEPGTRFLWLVPITNKERLYALDKGTDALEALLEQRHVDYLDFGRDSLV